MLSETAVSAARGNTLYDKAPKEGTAMPPRKVITISLPPPLLKQAEAVARAENRTKSELVREALRFYVETRTVRKEDDPRAAGAPPRAHRHAHAARAPDRHSPDHPRGRGRLASGAHHPRRMRAVSGDGDLLALKAYRAIPILRPAAFLAVVSQLRRGDS